MNEAEIVAAEKAAAANPQPDEIPPIEILNKIASRVDQLGSKTNEEVAALAISLARIIVEQLIGSSAEMPEQRLTQILQETMAAPQPAVGVYVNSSNLDFVSRQLEENSSSSGLKLAVDNSIAVGECRVEYESYDLISNIENQLDEIESHLAEIIDE
jgi:flagellar biosynthesis/type III secretory pathway protein FliH